MNDFTIKTPTIRVPGLLDDAAMQEQLKVFKQGVSDGAAPVPSSAVDMADRIQSEFYDTPVAQTRRAAPSATSGAAPDPQQRAVDVRSDILSSETVSKVSSFYLGGGLGFLAREGGVLDDIGTLTPEEQDEEQQKRIKDAQEYEANLKRVVDTRQKMRALTNDEAAAMGLPIAPGSDDPNTEREQREAAELGDAGRLERAAEATQTAQTVKPTKAWWLDAIRSFTRAQTEGYTGIGKAATIGLMELPGEIVGIRDAGRSDVRAWFDTVDQTMTKLLPPDAARSEDFMNTLTAGGGSMTSFLASSVVGGLIGIPAKASTTIVGAATGAAQQYEDAEQHHATAFSRLGAFFAGAGLGATEAIPINRMMGTAERATGGLVSRMLANSAAGSLEEFVQELGQNIGQDVVASWLYDEQRKFEPLKYLKAAAAGGILGAMGGSAMTTLQGSGVIQAPMSAEDQAQASADLDTAARQVMERRQTEAMERVITLSQNRFDQVVQPEQLAADRAETAAVEQVDTSVDAITEEVVTPPEGEAVEVFAQRIPKSEAFTAWFGDSKVVDAEGNPAVAYHGTNENFSAFDSGKLGSATGAPSARMGFFFSSDPSVASSYADTFNAYTDTPVGRLMQRLTKGKYEAVNEALLSVAGRSAVATGANVLPVYLNMRNPEVVDFKGDRYRDKSYASIVASAKAAGRDGVILRNTIDEGFNEGGDAASDVYVVFEPTQIKSVNNAGNFDPANPDILASTSRGRGSYTAEPQRQQGQPGQTSADADNVSLRQIANNFQTLLGLTVRQGRFTLKGADVMGQFSARSGVVRLRTPNDLSTLIHEGGHALELNADGALRSFIDSNKVQLETVARQLYGGDVSGMSQKERVSEGFAEFFRVYVTNRRFADTHHPTMTAAFDAMLKTSSPQIHEGLQLVGDQYNAWLQLPSAQLVRNMVQSGKQTTGINAKLQEMREQGYGNWFKEVVNGLFSASINRNNNLNILVADILNDAEARGTRIDMSRANDPRVLIRLAANSGNRAMVQLTDGVMGHRSTTPMSASLRDALLTYHGMTREQSLTAIDENRQRDFAAYTVALRGIDEYNRYAQGIISRPPLAATLGDLTQTVTELETQYGDDFRNAAQMVHDYGMALWQKSYDAGLLDDQTYQDGMQRGFYVPLQRDMSDKEITQSGIKASAVARGASIVKRFKGSDRDIIDPMDALMEKTFALEKVIAENEVKVALAKLADAAGTVGALVERVPASRMMGQQFSVEEVAKQLTKDPTMQGTDAQDLMNLLEAAIDDGNRIALFRSQQASAAGENIIYFWEKGKLAALQLKDGEVGTDILNTLNAVGTENVPLLVDLISYPSTVFRSAVTSWPDFLLVNFIRDQMSAFVLTEGYTPFVTGLRGVGDELRQGQWAREYNAAMGTMGGMNSNTLHDARVNRDIASLRRRGYVAQAFRDRSIAGAVKGIARVTELTETGTRLGIYRKQYGKAVADGLTPWEASVEAAYTATDYIDFGLHGNRMLAWRRLIPFLNAQLQGLNKMVRTLAGDEVRQRKGLRFAVTAFFKDINNLELSRTERQAVRVGRKAWLKMASLGIIGAAINAVFADDPDYQDASEYMRTTGWVIPIGDGQIIYVPKPFELAMVSNFVERGLESASGDKEAKNRLLRGMAMNLLPPTNPPAIQSIVEQAANWNSFSGNEIVPDYMRALEPELQYNHYTSEFAKSLGSMLGWSPMRIDHALSGLGASAYRDLNSVYNMTDKSRPSSDVTDWPITRRFVRDARRGAASAQDFWKFASTVNGSLRRAEVTYRNYLDSGREQAANDYLDGLKDDEKAYALLNAHFKADFKKLNPVYRTRQVTTIISAMRRELYSDLGVENSFKGMEDSPIMMSASEKAKIDDALSELARREVRNSLVYMKAPGWGNKKPLPTEPTIGMLEAINPDLADEFARRVKKAKVYSEETVQEYWPEVRDRLLRDRDQAYLKDIQTVAKAMR